MANSSIISDLDKNIKIVDKKLHEILQSQPQFTNNYPTNYVLPKYWTKFQQLAKSTKCDQTGNPSSEENYQRRKFMDTTGIVNIARWKLDTETRPGRAVDEENIRLYGPFANMAPKRTAIKCTPNLIPWDDDTDVPSRSCFKCWNTDGHALRDCPEKLSHLIDWCTSCGRRYVATQNCPRCAIPILNKY